MTNWMTKRPPSLPIKTVTTPSTSWLGRTRPGLKVDRTAVTAAAASCD